MNYKDIIVIVILIIILFVLLKVFQLTKAITAVKSTSITSSSKDNEHISNDDMKPRKIKVKIIYNRVLKLFSDDIPKTEETILSLYNKGHKKPVNIGKIRQICKWLNGKNLLEFEELEECKAWGLPDMFENEQLSKEYLSKIKT